MGLSSLKPISFKPILQGTQHNTHTHTHTTEKRRCCSRCCSFTEQTLHPSKSHVSKILTSRRHTALACLLADHSALVKDALGGVREGGRVQATGQKPGGDDGEGGGKQGREEREWGFSEEVSKSVL